MNTNDIQYVKKKKLPISVLIPTMNRPITLENTIRSYLKGEILPEQIVVVDQSKGVEVIEENKKMLMSFSKEIEITYIHQKIPSLTQARNRALSYAKHNILIFSDDDIEIYSDTLSNIFQKMKDDNIAMIAGIDDYSKISTSKIGYILGTKSFIHRKIGHVTLSMLGRFPNYVSKETETMWAMGFFFVLRKDRVKKWKLKWDENLTEYAYAEDLDFSYQYFKQAKRNHMKCIMSDQIHVKHLASNEYRTPSRRSTCMYVVNRRYLARKHKMGRGAILAMNWCDFWKVMERIIKNQNSQDLIDSMKYAWIHRKDIKNGKLSYLK